MELTVDGKARATTVVYTRRRTERHRYLVLPIAHAGPQVVALGPNAAITT
jgi:hypothetical protein